MPTTDSYIARIPGRNRDKPKFIASITAFLEPMVELQDLFQAIPPAFDIDTAVGFQLDIVGQWVGISRNVVVPLTGIYFSWDTANLGWDQGVWEGPYDPATNTYALDDDHYRFLLRCKIAANHWKGTQEDAQNILAILQQHIITGGDDVGSDVEPLLFIQDNFDMTIVIAMAGRIPSSTTVALISGGYIPLKAMGVSADFVFTSVDFAPLFGFDMDNDYVAGWDDGAWGITSISEVVPPTGLQLRNGAIMGLRGGHTLALR